MQVDSALVTMVLHHADDPAGMLRNIARFVPPSGPVVIGEFHPEGPCPSGPPRKHRLAPEKIQEWCEQAGLAMVGYRRQTPEHYVLFAQRSARRPVGRQVPAGHLTLINDSGFGPAA